jgi:hypothetical protein
LTRWVKKSNLEDMEDKKINIVRSFSRKINLGNYEMADFFASRSFEVSANTPLKEQQEISDELSSLVEIDVERDADEYLKLKDKDNGFSIKRLTEIIDEVSIGNPFPLEDFENLSPQEHKIIQSVKRAYLRSPMHKATLKPNTRGKE